MLKRLVAALSVCLAILILETPWSPLAHAQGLAAPILLVVNGSSPNPYGPYLAEILKAEGFNTFDTADLSTVTPSALSGRRLVVLAETPLSDAQASVFSNFVAGGGRMVAMRPDPRLAAVLSITPLAGQTVDGYIGINAASASGDGFTTTTLPFFGPAQNYALTGPASTVATLYSGQTTATPYPAVVRAGRTATWTYDLATSVVYARQGNPANAGMDRDGLAPIRTNDVFYNAIDKDRVNVPHADVQMRLFARVIADLLADALPLPQLWYFPNAAKTLLIVTADSHANPQSYFDAAMNAFNARNVKASIYIFNGSSPSVASVETWRSQGHEVGMHPAAYSRGVSLDQAYTDAANYFASNGYGSPSPTVRNHQIEWQGWVEAAKVAANHGVSMDTSFYTWGPAVIYPDGPKHQAHGYINGSGQMMRFVDQTGAIVPTWGLSTSLDDEQLIVDSCGGVPMVCSEELTGSQALGVSRQLIDASQAGHYAAVMTQFHIDYYGMSDVTVWANGTMDYANSLNIPNRTAEGFLAYTTARAATSLTGLTWTAASRRLSFDVSVPGGSEAQSVAVPGVYDGYTLTGITVDGSPAAVVRQTINGRSMAFVSVASGTHTLAAVFDTSPVVTAVSVTPGSGSGISQTFSLQYADTLGATDLSAVWVWFNASFAATSSNSCLLSYNRASNVLSLINDAGTAFLPGGVLGSAGTVQNSQCSVALGASAVTASAQTLTLNLAITFAPGFAGTKNVYMYAANGTGQVSAWQTRGTWLVPGPLSAVVTADSVLPASGNGASQTFALQYGDTVGGTDLATTWVWFNASFASTSANSCLLYYNRSTNALFLINDAGTAWSSGGTVGAAGQLQNSQCTVALASSSVVTTGPTVTMNLAMVFSSGFAGAKNVYMYGANGVGINSGWQTRGTWTVPGPAAAVVTADSATPNSGSGASQLFALRYSDTIGASDLSTAWVWFNASFASTSLNSCLLYYSRPANQLFLLNNAGTAWLPGATIGSAGTLQNNQCSVALGGSSVTVSGTALTLNLAMTFASGFSGSKNVYMYGANAAGVNSGWQTRGTWTVPGAVPVVVTADSVLPGSGSGASQTFALQYSDTVGASDLSTVWVWFNASFAATSANSCLLSYNQSSNQLFLINDAGTAWLPGATLGGPGTLQNSQCSIALGASSTSGAGVALTMNLAMTFAPGFSGAKNVYMYGANAGGVNSGWQARGTWIVP